MNIYKIYDLKERILKALIPVREGTANRNMMLLKLDDIIKNKIKSSGEDYPSSTYDTDVDDVELLSKKLSVQAKVLRAFQSLDGSSSSKSNKKHNASKITDKDKILDSFDFTEVECLREEVSDTFDKLSKMFKKENRLIEELIGLWYEFIRTDRVLSGMPVESESAVCKLDGIINELLSDKYGNSFQDVLSKGDIKEKKNRKK